MARNGVIELSYARSAGTGDQPVPGTITSRRNSSRQERVQLQKQRQQEEERLRKQRLEQEAVARILTQKWEEEDRRRSRRKRRGEQDGREESEEEEQRGKHARRFKEEAQDAGERAAEVEAGERPAEAKAERGEWVSVGREREDGHRSAASRRRGPAAEPEGHWHSDAEGAQPSDLRGRASAEDPVAREARGRQPADSASKAGHSAGGQRGRSVVPNVFGLSDSEEEAAGMKREMERAARSRPPSPSLASIPSPASHKAQARASETQRVAVGARSLPVSSGATSARTPPDLCTQLMKVAEWKRSCGGKRLPMPEEMKLEVAKAMGASV